RGQESRIRDDAALPFLRPRSHARKAKIRLWKGPVQVIAPPLECELHANPALHRRVPIKVEVAALRIRAERIAGQQVVQRLPRDELMMLVVAKTGVVVLQRASKPAALAE